MTGFTLKIIATVTMLIDHIGHTLMRLGYENVLLLRYIGRIAFPIFAFLIAVGAIKTNNIDKYFMRLAIFAIISQIPFAIVLGTNIFGTLNIFFTLAIGVLAISIIKIFDSRTTDIYAKYLYIGIILLVSFLIAQWLNTDFGGLGSMLIVALYLCKSKIHTAIIICLFMFLIYLPQTDIGFFMLVSSFVSLVPIMMYNGEFGKKVNKYFFYVFYPLHLAVLSLILM